MNYGLLAFVPIPRFKIKNTEIEKVTVPLLRITDGVREIYATEKGDAKLLASSQIVLSSYLLFKKAAGLVEISRFVKLDEAQRKNRYTYGAGDRAQLLENEGWHKEKVLGYGALRLFDGAMALPVLDFVDKDQQIISSVLGFYAFDLGDVIEKVLNPIELFDDLYERGKDWLEGLNTPAFNPEQDPGGPTRFFMLQRGIGTDNASVWIGRFARSKPTIESNLLYIDVDGNKSLPIPPNVWKSSIQDMNAYKCYYHVAQLKGLKPNSTQTIVFQEAGGDGSACTVVTSPTGLKVKAQLDKLSIIGGKVTVTRGTEEDFTAPAAKKAEAWSRTFRTWFNNIPRKGDRDLSTFTVFLGSCYSSFRDPHHILPGYHKLCWSHGIHPDLHFFAGDQVYLDSPWHEYELRYTTDQLRTKFTNRYLRFLGGLWMLAYNAGNIFISDDHEFHNDYPNPSFILPLQNEEYRTTWQSIAKKLFVDIQNPSPTYVFSIGNDITFFVADARINRKDPNFMKQEDMERLKIWIQSLNCPGVILSSQAILDTANGSEKNLTDFPQFVQLCTAISNSPHDIIFMTGDVHFGRVAQVQLKSGKWLYEIISSPLNLVQDRTGNMSGILARKAWKLGVDKDPESFPQVPVPEVSPSKIKYLKAVSAKESDPDRTAENFFTITFSKKPAGGVLADIKAWLPRRHPELASLYLDFEQTLELN
ncbi:MAG: hypothetical protein NDI90_15615 [Nitrospira sp. BO4]|jgi:hypothetical protein|nr:hypothetical protein [Nitrospira sp. BO4]